MTSTLLAIGGIVLALIPAGMFFANLPLFQIDDDDLEPWDDCEPGVSVLIPARDEELGIRQSVVAALASKDIDIEVVVLDDHSSDLTASIVQQLASANSHVRYLRGAPLPAGWNGKQHACQQLAIEAKFERIVFMDADVRLQESAICRMIRRQDQADVALLSAFPHQQTVTFLEQLIVPLMHSILLGFLPLARMRASAHPAYAAGCGQLFMTRRSDYRAAGTHAAIRSSRHDGLKLPRAYREAGLMTDVIDGTDLAECRMYRNATEVVRGVLKNAIEGIANPRLIVPFSIVLLGGSVLPVATLLVSGVYGERLEIVLSMMAVVIGHLPRAIAAARFRQPWAGVLFHSLAVLLFVLLQWVALAMHLRGRQVAWRGRTESFDHADSTT